MSSNAAVACDRVLDEILDATIEPMLTAARRPPAACRSTASFALLRLCSIAFPDSAAWRARAEIGKELREVRLERDDERAERAELGHLAAYLKERSKAATWASGRASIESTECLEPWQTSSGSERILRTLHEQVHHPRGEDPDGALRPDVAERLDLGVRAPVRKLRGGEIREHEVRVLVAEVET
jgi:hypothetical protein